MESNKPTSTYALSLSFLGHTYRVTNTLLMLSRALRGFRPRAALLCRARGAAPGLRGRRRCPLLACRCGSWPSRLCWAPWPLRGLSPGAALRGAGERSNLSRSTPVVTPQPAYLLKFVGCHVSTSEFLICTPVLPLQPATSSRDAGCNGRTGVALTKTPVVTLQPASL